MCKVLSDFLLYYYVFIILFSEFFLIIRKKRYRIFFKGNNPHRNMEDEILTEMATSPEAIAVVRSQMMMLEFRKKWHWR